MAIQFRMTAMLMALVLLGCKGVQPTSAASGKDSAAVSSPANGSGAAAASSDGATRIEYITDPTMNNMKVMPIQIPASWSFHGVLVPQGPCTQTVSEVFRATSPDGRSFMEVMPRMGWRWGNLWAAVHVSQDGCLPIHERISPQDFLKQFSTTVPVEYLGVEPDPQIENVVKTPGGTWQGGLANVRFKNGSVNMKGRMMAGLFCSQSPTAASQAAPGWGQRNSPQQSAAPGVSGGQCDAIVTFYAAPESQFSAVEKLWTAPGMGRHKEMDDWVAIFSQRYANRLQAWTTQFLNESNASFAARQQMYRDAAAVQQQAHNQFLQTMQEGTDRSMANAARIANSNHTMAADMVDYSLDRQTVLDTNTGQFGKISNQVTPAGALQKVHGDGTPY